MPDDQSTIAPEEWRDITPEMIGRPIREGYQISSTGRVRSRWIPSAKYGYVLREDRSRELSGRIITHPYKKKKLPYVVHTLRSTSRTGIKLLAHRLVAFAFLGKPPEGKTHVRHLDGNGLNNCVSNLAWGNNADNMQDMIRHGRTTRGERCASAVLTEENALEIVRAIDAGETQASCVRRFGISAAAVSLLYHGHRWSWLTGKTPRHRILVTRWQCQYTNPDNGRCFCQAVGVGEAKCLSALGWHVSEDGKAFFCPHHIPTPIEGSAESPRPAKESNP